MKNCSVCGSKWVKYAYHKKLYCKECFDEIRPDIFKDVK